MMTLKELVEHLAEKEIVIWLDGDAVKFKPASLVSEEIRDEMRRYKKEIQEILFTDFKQEMKTKTKNFRLNSPPVPKSTGGVGTEIKKILARFGIVATPNCSCNRNAKQADQWGPDECEKRADEIIGWMRAEATKRRLPFFDPVGRMILKRAIRAARKN